MIRYNIFSGTTKLREWLFVLKLLLKGNYNDDTKVIESYEDRFARTVSAKNAISFGAGRMALYAILEALDINENDEVIIPAFTCVVVPNAFIYRSIVPKYVDINISDFNIDVSKIESLITSKTKAIYAQHTFGIPCDMAVIRAIADKHGLFVIEDAAHSLGATFNGNSLGRYSDAVFYSTDHSKVISTYLGGMVTTNDDVIGKKIRNIQKLSPYLGEKYIAALLVSYLTEWLYFAPRFLIIGRYIHVAFRRLGLIFTFNDELKLERPTNYPYPCRLSSAQSSMGIMQLANLEDNLKHRREIAKFLEKNLSSYGFDEKIIGNYTWLRYSFLVKDRAAFKVKYKKKFDLGIWFETIFGGREDNFEHLGYVANSCPNAEFVARHVVNFPTHQRIPLKVFKNIIKLDKDWLKNNMIKR